MRVAGYGWLSVSALVLLAGCAPEPVVAPDKDAPVAGVDTLRTIEMAYLGPVLSNTTAEVELTTGAARNWPEKFLPVLEARLTDSKSFAKMPRADCALDTFDRKGLEFTATGQCRTKGVRLGTRFIFTGNNTADAFTILATMFPEAEGVTPGSRRMTMSGTLDKAAGGPEAALRCVYTRRTMAMTRPMISIDPSAAMSGGMSGLSDRI